MDKEAEWLEKLTNGNSLEKNQVLTEVKTKYFDRFKKYVNRNNGTHNDAEDAFQEGLIILYDNILLGKFKGRSSIFTYFFAICRNKFLSSKSKIQTKDILFDDLNLKEEKISSVDTVLIDDILESLSESCKQILKEYYIEGKSMNEIKSLFELGSVQSAKNKKYLCMKKLMEEIRKRNLSIDDFVSNGN